MTDPDLLGCENVEIETTVNGKLVKRQVKARQHLADFLRTELELTGTHLGCEHGVCGACTVLLDGRSVRSCLTLAAQACGRSVDTIEGMSASGKLAPLQRAFIERNAAQCGFCSSGMLLTAHELLGRGENMSRSDIRELISGNMCRCTGYHAIVDAIAAVLRRTIACGGTNGIFHAGRSATCNSLGGYRLSCSPAQLKRLLSGRGRYLDDIRLPRMLHAHFVRSPHPHARYPQHPCRSGERLAGRGGGLHCR